MAHVGVIKTKVRTSSSEGTLLSKGFIILFALAFLPALAYVHVKFEQTKIGYEISANNQKEKEALGENLSLRAEYMSLKSPERIEGLAKENGFKFPTQEDVIYIEAQTVVGDKE